jgi:hypothetical protein
VTIQSTDDYLAGLLPAYSLLKTSFTAEAAGVMFSPFYTAGNPGAAAAPTGLNGAALAMSGSTVGYAGQLPFPAAVSGDAIYCADLTVSQGGNVGAVYLCDRLWHNGTIATTTGAQAITFPTLPARDFSGSTAGVDVMLGIEVSSATGNGSAITNMTATYTDSDGNTGQTATVTSFPATAVAGTFVPFNLAAGDRGVRAVTSFNNGTTLSSGTVHLVAYRVIAVVGTPVASVGVSLPPAMPRRMFDNSVPFLLYDMVGTAGGVVSGTLQYCQT